VVCFLCLIWALLGYASLRQGGSSKLVDGGSYEKRCCLENGPSIVFCGVFGESEIIDVSRTCQGPERSSSISFLLLSILGLQAGLPRRLLAL
jgi:hypothetical protein